MANIFSRLDKDLDKDLEGFIKIQSDKSFAIKFLLRLGMRVIGEKKDLKLFKKQLMENSFEKVFKELIKN